MGKVSYDSYSVAREVFDTADKVLGFKLSELWFHGPADRLTYPERPACHTCRKRCVRKSA